MLRRAGTAVWEGGGSARGSEGREAGGGSAALEGGELEAAAQLWRAGRTRQRGYGGRGVGCSSVQTSEGQSRRRDAFAV